MPDPIVPPVPTIAPVVTPPTAQTVYSAPNITQAATQPVLPVNPAVEEYNSFMNTPELIEARNSVRSFQDAINKERQGLRTTTTGLEYQNDQAGGTTGASVNLIGRQVGRASTLASDRIAALGENLNAATAFVQGLEGERRNQYDVFQQNKSKIQSLIAQTGNKAGITLNDTYESAVEKAFNWQAEQDKKAEKKQKEAAEKAEKEQLKALVIQVGGSTKNKKGGSLSIKDLKKEYERLSGEKFKADKARSDAEWSMRVSNFNKGISDEKNKAITQLLSQAANMSDGGEEWAKRNAALYGLKVADVTPYLQGNWGDGYRTSSKSGPVRVDKEAGDWIFYTDGSRENKLTGEIQVQQ